jgi:hypothetical protein
VYFVSGVSISRTLRSANLLSTAYAKTALLIDAASNSVRSSAGWCLSASRTPKPRRQSIFPSRIRNRESPGTNACFHPFRNPLSSAAIHAFQEERGIEKVLSRFSGSAAESRAWSFVDSRWDPRHFALDVGIPSTILIGSATFRDRSSGATGAVCRWRSSGATPASVPRELLAKRGKASRLHAGRAGTRVAPRRQNWPAGNHPLVVDPDGELAQIIAAEISLVLEQPVAWADVSQIVAAIRADSRVFVTTTPSNAFG